MNKISIKELYKKDTGNNIDNLTPNEMLHNEDFIKWWVKVSSYIYSNLKDIQNTSLQDLIKLTKE